MNATDRPSTKLQIVRVGALLFACSVVSLGWALFCGDRLDPPAVVISCSYPKIPEVQKAVEGLGLKDVGISVKDPQESPMWNTALMFLVVLIVLVPSTAVSWGLYNYFCKLGGVNSSS
jgi:hypothetical protein